jgi:hypothetical protein
MSSIINYQKEIAESLNLYIKNHNQNAPELISKLSNQLCDRDFQHTLIEYDRKLLNRIVKIGLTYCIGTYSLNQYCKLIRDRSGYHLIVANLITGLLKFNQRNWMAKYMSELLAEVQQMLNMGQSIQKIKPLIHVYCLDFECSNFYNIVIDVHDNKLEEINNAQ